MIVVHNLQQLREILSLPTMLMYFNVFVVPQMLVAACTKLVRDSKLCLSNRVVVQHDVADVTAELDDAIDNVLAVGSPLEYVMNLHSTGQGLPDGAAKHLLRLPNENERE